VEKGLYGLEGKRGPTAFRRKCKKKKRKKKFHGFKEGKKKGEQLPPTERERPSRKRILSLSRTLINDWE